MMNRCSFLPFVLFLVLLYGCAHNQQSDQQASSYTGQEAREIKALTSQEVDGYLSGTGMGLAKVAELNQYPGPKHVLELAEELELSIQQKEQTITLFNEMKEKAINIGGTYIAKERELNQMFESGIASSPTVDSLLVEIGKIKGTLRAAHVNTHIQMKEILTADQIKKYDELRGYGNENSKHHHQ